MNSKIEIYNAVIEITRRCNMKCEHCLRGKAQNCDIKNEYLDSFFSKCSYISNLTLTGGEPSIAVDRIEAVIEHAKKHHVDIGNFYIVTNAKQTSPEFIVAIAKLYAFCSDNESSGLAYSSDRYHDEVNQNNIRLLKAFSFTREKKMYSVISEGKGKRINPGNKKVSPERYEIDENTIVDGMVYLNCLGNIISNCDFSYTNQNKKRNIVCHVDEMKIEKFEEYNIQFN